MFLDKTTKDVPSSQLTLDNRTNNLANLTDIVFKFGMVVAKRHPEGII